MSREITISSAAGTVTVELVGTEAETYTAKAGLTGLGFPPVEVQWFVGAGAGAVFLGARNLSRDLTLPIKICGSDQDELLARLSLLGQVLDPDAAPAKFVWTVADETWSTDIVRTGGGDWAAGEYETTDLETYVITTLNFRAGAPFWTRDTASQQTVKAQGLGRGLLGTGRSLSKLRVSSGQAMGSVLIENTGDASAYPVTIAVGPGTALDLVSPKGELLHWEGTLLAGQRRVFDHAAKTLVDPDDSNPVTANRYDELGPAPLFWAVPPGNQTATVELTGATSASSVTLSWRPRRRLVV